MSALEHPYMRAAIDGEVANLASAAKRLDRGRFVWPVTVDGVVALTAAQMSYLLEAIDWRNPQLTWRPQSAG
jgi:transposase